ncbi:hypothetical protein NC651_012151 [Populus alba x Populus x berolinensis]|nr:hypothetical protein NC651_012151 [Populus alba x Populus x berolinensis]
MAGGRSIKMGEINVTSSRHAKSHQAHDFSRKHHDVARKSSSCGNRQKRRGKNVLQDISFMPWKEE